MESIIIEKLMHVDDTIDIDEANLTPIQEFYKDANVFITGGTGFLGQILIEKLLRSCPIAKLYLLVRKKKGKGMNARLNAIFDDPLFDRLKKTYPNVLQNVVAIEGDCTVRDLGLNDQDKRLLIDEVNVIFHVAATVRFDEKLKTAVAINVRATRDLSALAQQMPHLKSFLHVSTAYSNCIQDVIDEKVYPTELNYQHLIMLTESIDDLVLEQLTSYFVGSYPNTYIYTKQAGESVVKEETKGLPSAIYRPPIVLSTYKEPVRGWINNIYGATGVFYGAGLGLIRVMYCKADATAVMVPADMCVNGMIASAWDAAGRFRKSKEEQATFEMPVYNYENTTDQPLTWDDYKNKSSNYGKYTPSIHSIWIYILTLVDNYNIYVALTYLLHLFPAYIIDAVMFCLGKEVRLVKAYKKIHKFTGVIGYFSVRSYKFNSANIHSMLARASQKDRGVFFCDLRHLDWDDYFLTYAAGARIYLVKDPMDTLPQAKVMWNRYLQANGVLMTFLGLLALAMLWFVTSTFYSFIFV